VHWNLQVFVFASRPHKCTEQVSNKSTGIFSQRQHAGTKSVAFLPRSRTVTKRRACSVVFETAHCLHWRSSSHFLPRLIIRTWPLSTPDHRSGWPAPTQRGTHSAWWSRLIPLHQRYREPGCQWNSHLDCFVIVFLASCLPNYALNEWLLTIHSNLIVCDLTTTVHYCFRLCILEITKGCCWSFESMPVLVCIDFTTTDRVLVFQSSPTHQPQIGKSANGQISMLDNGSQSSLTKDLVSAVHTLLLLSVARTIHLLILMVLTQGHHYVQTFVFVQCIKFLNFICFWVCSLCLTTFRCSF